MNDDDPVEELYSGEWLRLVKRENREFVIRRRCTGIAIVIAVNDRGDLILTEQYRAAVSARVLELPAGLVGDEAGQENETIADAASRELLEETGYRARTLEQVVAGPISAGLSSETLTFFYSRDVVREGEGGGDATEDIVVHEAPLDQMEDYLERIEKNSLLVDPKIYIGLYFARNRR